MKSTRHKLFRFFYKTFYTLLNAALFILILITPGDTIRQALDNKQIYNVFVIAGCYVLTLFLAVLIYFSRIFTNKSILKAIPKTWIPVEKGDVKKKVRKMIVTSLNRSAAIAWDARPRVPPQSTTIISAGESGDPVTHSADTEADDKGDDRNTEVADSEKGEATVIILPPPPIWGDIAHNGWSSPMSPDLSNLQYTTVILELPHLIEAKAVSLAPPDSTSTSQPPLADIRAVELLQRPASMGLHDYVIHLSSIGIITSPTAAAEFLSLYEYARFSGQPISELEFRELMKGFAELLRNIKALSRAVITSLHIEQPQSDIDNDGTSSSTPTTPRSRSLVSSHRASSRSDSERTTHSRYVARNGSTSRTREGFITAPATPRSKKRVSSSANSFAQSKRPYSGDDESSSDSLRSVSQSSVIRLRRSNEEGELPYTLNILGSG